jgi:hypothetical protein
MRSQERISAHVYFPANAGHMIIGVRLRELFLLFLYGG